MSTEIPEEAFSEILKELRERPLQTNNYRNKSGSGKSQAFGVVNRRSLPPDYSRNCWLRPKLYKLLLDFAETYVDLSFNAITVNQNYKADKHRDRHNRGPSFLVAFGEYQGGYLLIHEGDLSGNHDICRKPIRADFSKVLHSVDSFVGERYSLVFYNFWTPRLTSLPPPSVKEEKGKYYFYRGDQRITQKEGLPHPLRGRKKAALSYEEKETTIRFE